MSDARFFFFFAIVVALSAALHAWMGLRLIRPLGLEGRSLVVAWSLVVVSAVAVPGTFLLLPTSGHPVTAGSLEAGRRHAEIVERFGRFPHRNGILGRQSTAEELAFLQEPGSSF